MRGVRFYFDYGDAKTKRKGGDAPNALAVDVDSMAVINGERMYSAGGAVYDYGNSPCAGTSVSGSYLRTCCKRVAQAEALRAHPNLAQWLQQGSTTT